MFVLRRVSSRISRGLPPAAQTLWRGNASISAVTAGSEPAPPPPPPSSALTGEAAEPTTLAATAPKPSPISAVPPRKTQGRRKTGVRPQISLESPREWKRPIEEGIIPAYDLALEYLKEDSQNLKAEVQELERDISEMEKEYQSIKQSESTDPSVSECAEALDEELERLRKKLHIIEVQSEVNLPEVRWSVANAMAQVTKPSHRHLLEQRWRKDGDLDLLMERIYQMNVVPDLLPAIHPSIDVRVVTPATPAVFHKTGKVDSKVEPGSFILPTQTVKPPKLYVNVFHADTRLYTMLLVDPDVPDEENASYTTFLHWMKPNIPLSATSPSRIPDLNSHTQYIPPHPQNGSPYHRYTTLLLPQPPAGASNYSLNMSARAGTEPTSQHLDIPVVSVEQRRGFDVRAFCQQWGLDAASGGGVHMWREVWSEEVSKIYSETLKLPEPRYTRPPKADRYAEVKRGKRYVA
ncbi:phosphatidylethanolamine-binding protein [Cyathus striatus]|nr:phosphatidylethanolamine-binding protein [Cyathus striatus]